MFFRYFLLIYLFGFISNLTTNDHLYEYNGEMGIYFVLNRRTKNDSIHIKWHDIVFISILILLLILFLACLYYQRSIFNFLSTLCSKTKSNDDQINQHNTTIHQTSPIKNLPSMYLTVPQPSYIHP